MGVREMAVIIGFATQVTGSSPGGGNLDGVISAQWSINPQISRLWELGSTTPYYTLGQNTKSANITVYGGGGPNITPAASTTCDDGPSRMTITIQAGSCTGASTCDINGETYFINSYSYSKGDTLGFGQQSYSMQQWLAPDGFTGTMKILEGVAEGNTTPWPSSTGADTGVTLATETQNNPHYTGTQGSVSAGFPGVGQCDTVTFGTVSSISNGDGQADGKVGQAQVSIPHQPIYF